MGTAGNTSAPSNLAEYYYTSGNAQQVAAPITMPEAGTIRSLSAYFAGDGASASAKLCLWGSTGALLRQSGAITVASGPRTPGGQGWHTASIEPYQASSGGQLYVGFSVSPSDRAVWSTGASGSHRVDTGSAAWPSSLGGSSYSGYIGAYVTYDTGCGVYVRTSAGAWKRCSVYVRTSAGAWKRAQIEAMKAGGWWP